MRDKQGKNIRAERIHRYGIRKLSVGVASVALATSLLFVSQASVVRAANLEVASDDEEVVATGPQDEGKEGALDQTGLKPESQENTQVEELLATKAKEKVGDQAGQSDAEETSDLAAHQRLGEDRENTEKKADQASPNIQFLRPQEVTIASAGTSVPLQIYGSDMRSDLQMEVRQGEAQVSGFRLEITGGSNTNQSFLIHAPENTTGQEQAYTAYFGYDGNFTETVSLAITLQAASAGTEKPSEDARAENVDKDAPVVESGGSTTLIVYGQEMDNHMQLVAMSQGKKVEGFRLITVNGDSKTSRIVTIQAPENLTEQQIRYQLYLGYGEAEADLTTRYASLTLTVLPKRQVEEGPGGEGEAKVPQISEIEPKQIDVKGGTRTTTIKVLGKNLTNLLKVKTLQAAQEVADGFRIEAISGHGGGYRDVILLAPENKTDQDQKYTVLLSYDEDFTQALSLSATVKPGEVAVTPEQPDPGEEEPEPEEPPVEEIPDSSLPTKDLVSQATVLATGKNITLTFTEDVTSQVKKPENFISLTDGEGNTLEAKAWIAMVTGKTMNILLDQAIPAGTKAKIHVPQGLLLTKDKSHINAEASLTLQQEGVAKITGYDIDQDVLTAAGGTVKVTIQGQGLKADGKTVWLQVAPVGQNTAEDSQPVVTYSQAGDDVVANIQFAGQTGALAQSYRLNFYYQANNLEQEYRRETDTNRGDRPVVTVMGQGMDIKQPVITHMAITSYETNQDGDQSHTTVSDGQGSKKTQTYIYGANLDELTLDVYAVDQFGRRWPIVPMQNDDTLKRILTGNSGVPNGFVGGGTFMVAEIILPNQYDQQLTFTYHFAPDGKHYIKDTVSATVNPPKIGVPLEEKTITIKQVDGQGQALAEPITYESYKLVPNIFKPAAFQQPGYELMNASVLAGKQLQDLPDTVTLQYRKSDERVHFADAQLEAAILALLKQYQGQDLREEDMNEFNLKIKDATYRIDPKAEYLTVHDLAMIEELAIRGYDENGEAVPITSLKGLEFATHLQALTLSGGLAKEGTGVEDLSFLSELTELSFLRLSHNAITDLKPLSKLTKLEKLYLSHNQIRDLSPLAQLTRLLALDLAKNAIVDLTSLVGLTQLKDLTISGNQVTDLSPLASLSRLEALRAGHNNIEDIKPLASLGQLEILYLGDNQLSDLTSLQALEALKDVDLQNNAIQAGDFSALKALESLNLSHNQLTDISSLQGAKQLTTLYLSHNNIHDIAGLAGLKALKNLSLDHNHIANWTPLQALDLDSLEVNGQVISTTLPLVAQGASVSFKNPFPGLRKWAKDGKLTVIVTVSQASRAEESIQAEYDADKDQITLQLTPEQVAAYQGQSLPLKLTISFQNKTSYEEEPEQVVATGLELQVTEDTLQKAKADAKAEIEALDLHAEQVAIFVAKVDAAESVDAVQAVVKEAEDFKKAQDAEAAEKALQDAKKDAKAEITKLGLAEDKATEFNGKVDDAKTVDAVKAVVDEAKAAKEAQDAEAAEKALQDAKKDAKAEIAKLGLAEDKATEFNGKVDAAKTVDAVQAVVKEAEDFKKAQDAEAAENELKKAKEDAKNEIYKLNLGEEKIRDYTTRINEAKSLEEVQAILAEAKESEEEPGAGSTINPPLEDVDPNGNKPIIDKDPDLGNVGDLEEILFPEKGDEGQKPDEGETAEPGTGNGEETETPETPEEKALALEVQELDKWVKYADSLKNMTIDVHNALDEAKAVLAKEDKTYVEVHKALEKLFFALEDADLLPKTGDEGQKPGTGDQGTQKPGTGGQETEKPGQDNEGEKPGTGDQGTQKPGQDNEGEKPGTGGQETEKPAKDWLELIDWNKVKELLAKKGDQKTAKQEEVKTGQQEEHKANKQENGKKLPQTSASTSTIPVAFGLALLAVGTGFALRPRNKS